MNINDLTVGQAKELANMFGGQCEDKRSSMLGTYIGKYVICRSRNEGINAGFVKALDDTGVILDEARRLHYHKPVNKNMSWYEGVAESGIDGDCRVSNPVTKVIIEDYSLTLCSEVAKKSISQVKTNAQG